MLRHANRPPPGYSTVEQMSVALFVPSRVRHKDILVPDGPELFLKKDLAFC